MTRPKPLKRNLLTAMPDAGIPRPPDFDEARFASEWSVLGRAVDSILVSNESGSLSTVHQTLERLCRNEQFFERIHSQLLATIDQSYARILDHLAGHFSLDDLLSILSCIESGAPVISSLFEVLHARYFVEESLESLMLRKLKIAIHDNTAIVQQLSRDIATAIAECREESLFRQSLSGALSVTIDFGLQMPVFEAIEAVFASYFSGRISNQLSAIDMIAAVQTALKRELELARILPQELADRLLHVTRRHLYVELFQTRMPFFVDQLFEDGPPNYRAISQLADLTLASRNIELNDYLIECLSRYAISMCEQQLSHNSLLSVRDLVRLLSEFHDLVSIYHVPQVEFAMKYMRGVLNANCHRTIEIVTRYIHQQMLKHDDAFLGRLAEFIFFVEQLEDDSYFFYCFRQFLGIRLVASCSLNAAVQPEINRDEIQLLTEMRHLFTRTRYKAMKDMLRDMKNFSSSIADFKFGPSPSCKVMFLSVERWPSFPTFGLAVIPAIRDARSQFELFCKRVHPGRVVRWVDALESCVFTYQGITVVASSLQTVVFECIVNSRDLSETALPDDVCQDVLVSLVRAGFLIKRKEAFRLAVVRPMRRVSRINSYTYCFPEKLAEASADEVFKRRRAALESLIARVLKSKGALEPAALFRECAIAFRFPLSQTDFRECVTMLLAKCLIMKRYDGLFCSCALS
jgi:hypothetical protein